MITFVSEFIYNFNFNWHKLKVLKAMLVVSKNNIGKAGVNVNETNIKYSTIGFGYIHYMNDNAKLGLWYDKITNEKTQLKGFTNDLKDDVLTCRLQFRF